MYFNKEVGIEPARPGTITHTVCVKGANWNNNENS